MIIFMLKIKTTPTIKLFSLAGAVLITAVALFVLGFTAQDAAADKNRPAINVKSAKAGQVLRTKIPKSIKAKKVVWEFCSTKPRKNGSCAGKIAVVGSGRSYTVKESNAKGYIRVAVFPQKKGKKAAKKITSRWLGPIAAGQSGDEDNQGSSLGVNRDNPYRFGMPGKVFSTSIVDGSIKERWSFKVVDYNPDAAAEIAEMGYLFDEPEFRIIRIQLEVTNINKISQDFNKDHLLAVDTDYNDYPVAFPSANGGTLVPFFGTVNMTPGDMREGSVYFIVPVEEQDPMLMVRLNPLNESDSRFFALK